MKNIIKSILEAIVNILELLLLGAMLYGVYCGITLIKTATTAMQ
jgi:hypothetical protein